MSFIANESQAHIGSVLLNGEEDYKIADGNTSFTFTAQLIDNNNNAIKKSGLPINWTHNKGNLVKLADHSLTDENGITTVTLYSTTKAVDAVQVSASYAGTASQSADKTVSFIANKDLAKLGEVKLVGQETRKIADGKEKFIFTVQLFDVNDNPIKKSDLIVYWAHDKPGKAQLNPTSKTDKDGVATVELQSTTMAIDDIEVSAKFGNDDKNG